MASFLQFVAVMVLMLLPLWVAELEGVGGIKVAAKNLGGGLENSLRSYQCPSRCQYRCSQTQYKKPCLFFCNKCCNKCLCVPPGFYGNKQACPCYNNWKTKRGTPKQQSGTSTNNVAPFMQS